MTKNLPNRQYGSLNLIPIMGYVVLDVPTSKKPNPEIKNPETFDNEEDAIAYARELYNNAEDNFINEVCFEGIIGFEPRTRKGTKIYEDTTKNIDILIEENIERVTEAIKDLANKTTDTKLIKL